MSQHDLILLAIALVVIVGIVIAIVATLPLLLGWLIAYPVFAGSIYASYREIWHGEGA